MDSGSRKKVCLSTLSEHTGIKRGLYLPWGPVNMCWFKKFLGHKTWYFKPEWVSTITETIRHVFLPLWPSTSTPRLPFYTVLLVNQWTLIIIFNEISHPYLFHTLVHPTAREILQNIKKEQYSIRNVRYHVERAEADCFFQEQSSLQRHNVFSKPWPEAHCSTCREQGNPKRSRGLLPAKHSPPSWALGSVRKKPFLQSERGIC